MKRVEETHYLKVTTTKLYYFERSRCNGWPIEEVIDKWFMEYPIDSYHAARDVARIGNSQKLVSAEVIEEKDIKAYFEGGMW